MRGGRHVDDAMTVLEQYQRLECDGVWQHSASAQRRNVFVALGEASLVISDQAGNVLAHWSLPAVERIDAGPPPARYRPARAGDGGAGETLEIADETMVAAIRQVQAAIARAQPKPGRLRRGVLWASLGAAALLGVAWLPGALARHTAAVLPAPLAAEIGQRLLRQLHPITGTPCTAPEGLRALAALRDGLLPAPPGWNAVVVPSGPVTSAALPGRLILLRADLATEAEGPDAAAGALLTEAVRAGHAPPLRRFLDAAGPWTSLSLLTRGAVPAGAIAAHADGVLIAPRPDVPAAAFRDAFAKAGLQAEAYLARAAPPETWTGPAPEPAAAARTPLDEAAWLQLQAICDSG